MAEQLGAFTNSVRAYSRHQRYRSPTKVGTGSAVQFNTWIAAQVSRLSSSTSVIFGKLQKYTADRIAQATNISQIP